MEWFRVWIEQAFVSSKKEWLEEMFLYGLSPANQYFTSLSNRHQDTFRAPFSCLHNGRIRWEKSPHLIICIISPNDLTQTTG